MVSTIQAVDPAHLHDHWPFILRGLNAILAKGKDSITWWVEDVYGAVLHKAAAAFVVNIGEVPVGFFIVYPQDIPWVGKKELFVWVTYSLPMREWNGLDVGAAALETLQFLANLAVQQKLEGIRMLTMRRGYLRKYKDFFQFEFISCKIPPERLAAVAKGA